MMAQNIEKFTYDTGAEIRTVLQDGDPWFVLADLCAALGIENSRNVTARLDDDMVITVRLADGNRGNPNVTVVNEAGLYDVILRSDKPQAKPFRRWITTEVLPSIRRTGAYIDPNRLDPVALARAILAAERGRQLAQAELEQARPAVDYFTEFVADSDAMTVTDFAAHYGMSVHAAYAAMVDHGIVYRKSLGTRWSNTQGRKVAEHEYRAHAKYLPYFDLRPHHDAPRLYNGQLRNTLYVRSATASELHKLIAAPRN